jgi:arylsulfatase A-like enzyme
VEVGDVVQLFDIVATTLELASIKPEHVHFSRSLMPYMSASAKPAGFTPRAFVYTEGGYATNEPRDHEGWDGLPDEKDDYYYKELLEQDLPISVCRTVSVRNLTAKLVFRSDPKAPDHYSELYDLVADPFELSNKYADPAYAPLRTELKEEMLRWLVQTSDITPWSVCDRNSGKCDKTPFRRRRRRRQ